MILKPNIHPKYEKVVFHDTAADAYFLVGSTIKTERTIDYEGKIYPYVTIDISSASHPFYTGEQRAMNKDGRIAKFKNRFGNIGSKK
jgi:large subunit ribosomal protein L31|tara:strand:- start:2095 stop:2355 length:261 start_codon:yes stop_codon:yes gene_type:complete